MSIKPVDMQITITKSNEVSKQKHEEERKEGVIHQQEASNIKEESDKNMTRVTSNQKAKGSVISKDKENNKSKEKENKSKKNKNKPNKFDDEHIIDIEI